MNELDSLINRFKSYQKIPFHLIKLINQMIIFSYGMMSEYSFENIFLEKYHISISKDEMLEYFSSFNDIYQLVEGEDVILDKPFISFKNEELLERLKIYLKDVYLEASELIYLEYSKFRYNPLQENIFFILRTRALLSLKVETMYLELTTKDELFLGYYEGKIRYKQNDQIIERYVKDETLDKAILDYIYDEDDLIDKCIALINKANKDNLMKNLIFIKDHVIKVYQEYRKDLDINILISTTNEKLVSR